MQTPQTSDSKTLSIPLTVTLNHLDGTSRKWFIEKLQQQKINYPYLMPAGIFSVVMNV